MLFVYYSYLELNCGLVKNMLKNCENQLVFSVIVGVSNLSLYLAPCFRIFNFARIANVIINNYCKRKLKKEHVEPLKPSRFISLQVSRSVALWDLLLVVLTYSSPFLVYRATKENFRMRFVGVFYSDAL